MDVTRGEGEKVGVNQTVALIYRDDQARQSQEQQEALRLEITQLQYALGQGEDVSSAAKLNDDILNAMVSLRTASAQQDFSDWRTGAGGQGQGGCVGSTLTATS